MKTVTANYSKPPYKSTMSYFKACSIRLTIAAALIVALIAKYYITYG
ncbi:hypothetical protein [Planctobacterium marinum]|uniref:Uncharacterized protein n=1 Tax=Planctobacterium marinum TaxID=1631968 RepID=A0AA48HMD3_9ALTE|nr:hypothetical protein MACH26_29720 [Planctobacterium marinum]